MTTREMWSRAAGPFRGLPAAGVILLGVVLLAIANGLAWWMWAPVFLAVCTAGCGLVRISVDAGGVRVACGPVPVRTVALEKIAKAEAGYARPFRAETRKPARHAWSRAEDG